MPSSKSSKAVDVLAGQLKTLLIDESRELLKGVRPEDELFFQQLALDIATQQIAASVGTPERRRIAIENLESLRNTARSRVASSALRFAPKGEEILGKVLGVVIKTAVATAIAAI